MSEVKLSVPDFLVWHCAGCGAPAVGTKKPCDCLTNVGTREGPNGKREQTFWDAPPDPRAATLSTYRALLEKAAVDCGALVAKLDEINAHPAFQSVFAMAAIHGAEYRGPNYSDALEHARATLASIREALGKGREG
jgi:hypothetical protein